MTRLVGVAEIAKLIGVSRQRVNEIVRTDPQFPVPEAELAAGRIWTLNSIEAWMRARERGKKGAAVSEINGVTMVQPAEFGDAQLVADPFVEEKPVVVDLRGLDLMLLRRFMDFSSGLAYGLKGSAETIVDHVVLLEPRGTKLDRDARRAVIEALSRHR